MREIDPEIRAFADLLAADWRSHPPLAGLTMAAARDVAEKVRERWRIGGPEMAQVTETTFPTACGPMRLRSYRPHGATAGAAMVYLHGGGFTLFSIDTHDRLMREYADASKLTVIGLDYALSPEHKFPVALEQVVGFVRALDGHPDVRTIALGGDSAGANLALSAAVALRDAGRGDLLRALLLNYGAFGPRHSDEAEALWGGPEAVLNRAEMEVFWDNYLAHPAGRLDPAVNLLDADLRRLPPALLVVPECDILAEQSHAIAERLGPRAETRVYSGATHSFLEAMSMSALARQAIAESAAWLRAKCP
jgi:acetyl esterase